jgi:hypothetical protein
MSCRRIGLGLALCALALAAPAARTQAEPIRLAALTPPDDAGLADGFFDSALDCLALNVYWEARAEPRLGQIAVAEVTLNRVADPEFPHTVCGVVRQGEERGLDFCQFSWHCDGVDDRPLNLVAWQNARRLALLALSGRLHDPTDGALWFHSDQVHPDWPELAPIVKIGSHIFYRTAPGKGRTTTAREAPPVPPAGKPAPPVRLVAAEVIPAPAPPVPALAPPIPAHDPDPASDGSRACGQALAGAGEADFLAMVDRMRRAPDGGRASCGAYSSDAEQAAALAPASPWRLPADLDLGTSLIGIYSDMLVLSGDLSLHGQIPGISGLR